MNHLQDDACSNRDGHGDGVEFLTSSAGDWSGSYFAIHNWWHRTLYHLELGETEEALRLYDSPIRAGRSTEWLDVVDAAALLWRLSLFGVDVTDRAVQLAADIDDLVGDPVYIFNDWHALMAFGLAGDQARVERVILANRHLTAPTNDITTLPNPLKSTYEPDAIDLILMGNSMDIPLKGPVKGAVPDTWPVAPPKNAVAAQTLAAPVPAAPQPAVTKTDAPISAKAATPATGTRTRRTVEPCSTRGCRCSCPF